MRKDRDASGDEAGELAGNVDLDDVSEDDLDSEAILEDDDLEELIDEEEEPDFVDPDLIDDDDVDDVDDVIVVAGEDDEEPTVTDTVSLDADTVSLEDEDEDLEDEDDVEASLDVILKERLVVIDDEDEDEEETPDAEDRADGTMRVLPKQPGEFVCQSCFLVKHQSQLADSARMLCRDCV